MPLNTVTPGRFTVYFGLARVRINEIPLCLFTYYPNSHDCPTCRRINGRELTAFAGSVGNSP